jgi:hypothetical protein
MAGHMHMSASTGGSTNGEYKKIVLWICTIAALGGLLFGLDQGFIANSLETIEKVYHLGVKVVSNTLQFWQQAVLSVRCYLVFLHAY